MGKARYRPRKEIKMWLYRDKDDESRLIDFVQYCKQTRQFARMLRNGIRLMWSLGEGDTSILFELFPGLQAQLAIREPSPPPDHSLLERQIADLKQIILTQGSPVEARPQLQSGGNLGKNVTFSLPLVDDDDDDGSDTIVLKKSTATTAMDNFFASMLKADQYAERKAAEKEARQGNAPKEKTGRVQKQPNHSNQISL